MSKKEWGLVFLAIDRQNLSDHFLSFPLPVTNRSLVQRIKNILPYEKSLKNKGMTLFTSIPVQPVLSCKIDPHHAGFNIHDHQHPTRKIIGKTDVYGSHTIGISPNLLHLEKEIGLRPEKLCFISNGFDLRN